MTKKPAAAIAGLCRIRSSALTNRTSPLARAGLPAGGEGSWVRPDIFCNLSNCEDNGPVFCGRLPPAPLTGALAMLRFGGSLCGTRKRANIESRTMLNIGDHNQPW